MIKGIKYDWESITLNMDHGELIDITSIDYDDERELEALYGKGSKPVGVGRGNYKGTGKLTMRREEFIKMEESAGSSIYEMEPWPIVASYAKDGEAIQTDTLEQCMFTKRKNSHKQGDKETSIELDFIILGNIKINGKEAWK